MPSLPLLQPQLPLYAAWSRCSSLAQPSTFPLASLTCLTAAQLLVAVLFAVFGCRSSGLLASAGDALTAGSSVDQSGADSVAAVQRALVWPLEVLAQQHRCHVLLYDACELLLTTGLLDSERMQMHMRQEVADAGGNLSEDSFTFYVMERCAQAVQCACWALNMFVLGSLRCLQWLGPACVPLVCNRVVTIKLVEQVLQLVLEQSVQ